ncbi:MAG: sulfatase, partial [Planctomycetes bacterium]|nr:sulfatase [Planctomycetota bacterium]
TVLSIAGVQPPDWMQGQAFAGTHQTAPQPFLFGERGRMDECHDLVRSVTDGRYVYLRNYYPHVSQAQHVTYQFETPTTRVWRAIFDQGKATEAQSIFWRVPKAPEELYDLQSDPDEVHNLAASPAHRAILEKLRQAQRDRAAATRDVGFLPEGEIHSRSQGSTPYDMARDESKYPFERIVAAAELASGLESSALPQLVKLLEDGDSAVRYWAALGILMRGQDAVSASAAALRAALKDASPHVRIVAAQALAQYGSQDALSPALATLSELAPPQTNGVFVAMSALSAIEALGPKAASVREMVRKLDPQGPSPDARFNSYVPRLIANITGEPNAPAPAGKGKARGNRNKQKQ